MSDWVSRQAAIDYFFRPYSNEELYSNVDIERVLMALPSVEPERKKGKWIHHRPPDDEITWLYICDQCGHVAEGKPNFCPNCGSYNGGKNEV